MTEIHYSFRSRTRAALLHESTQRRQSDMLRGEDPSRLKGKSANPGSWPTLTLLKTELILRRNGPSWKAAQEWARTRRESTHGNAAAMSVGSHMTTEAFKVPAEAATTTRVTTL